jgi:hypothetical protein
LHKTKIYHLLQNETMFCGENPQPKIGQKHYTLRHREPVLTLVWRSPMAELRGMMW